MGIRRFSGAVHTARQSVVVVDVVVRKLTMIEKNDAATTSTSLA